MKISVKVIAVIFLLVQVTIPLFSFSRQDKPKTIEQLMRYCHENDLFNGTVLVSENGIVIYKKAFGYANFEKKLPLMLHTPTCLGSVSKQFTAMAIMMLKERNKLGYEDKLAKYFPEIPNAARITIRNLLNHTSGIQRGYNSPGLKKNGTLREDITNQDVYKELVKQNTLDFNPGEKYSYSNCGYILLALIVEKVSGISFPDFMQRNIFDPLHMRNSYIRVKNKIQGQPRAIGYNQYGEKSDYTQFMAGAGGIFSTVEDLRRWDLALYTEKLVAQTTLKDAFTPGLLNDGTSSRKLSDSTWGYGFGWLLRKNDSQDIVWHDGGFNGFSALFYRELNRKDCIIILCNKGQMGSNAPVYPIQKGLLQILKGQAYVLPKIPISTKMRRMIENDCIEEAVNDYHRLKKNHFAKYDFSESQLNHLGYHYLSKNKIKEAISIFKLNVAEYPDSANVYDSLGEAYLKAGRNDLARKNYAKSLELNAGNKNAMEMLQKLHK